jgi:hypothetical protein
VFRSRGHLQEFEAGYEVVHPWRRTITKNDTVLVANMLLHFNRLYFNRDAPRLMAIRTSWRTPHLLFNVVPELSVRTSASACQIGSVHCIAGRRQSSPGTHRPFPRSCTCTCGHYRCRNRTPWVADAGTLGQLSP